MCDSCDTRGNTVVSIVFRWVVRVMGVYAGGGYSTYTNLNNERGVQS